MMQSSNHANHDHDHDHAATTIVQFQAPDLTNSGPPLDIPLSSTPKQLTNLLNDLLSNDEPLPYAFFLTNTRTEIITTLREAMTTVSATRESIVPITFQPQSLFRVRAITRCTSSLPGHTESILDAAFSPDSRLVATASGDTTVRLWNPTTQIPDRTLAAHKNWVLIVAFSPDSKRLASASMDSTLRIWDLATDTSRALKAHTKWITSLSWKPFHLDPSCVRLVSASKDCSVRVWDVCKSSPLKLLGKHSAAVTCVRWSGEDFIYSSSQDRTIRVWHPVTGIPLRIIAAHGHWVNSMALSTDYLLRCGAFPTLRHDRPYVADPLSQAEAQQRYHNALEKAGGVERMVSGSDDFTLMLWHNISRPGDDRIKPEARMTGHQQLVNHVAFSPDGFYIASASFDKSVRLWNGISGKFICTLRGHVGAVYRVAWSADSRLLMSASRDSTCKIWDLRTRKLKSDLPGHSDEVYAVDWSVDGSCAVSAGKDRMVKLWHH